jgi:MerR family transcriptional regulator, copper efflux regulator
MMLIGELSQATGLSREALRFYEQAGLIQSRRLANGYRSYVPEAVEIVRYIRTAQQLGFTLAEIHNKLPLISEGDNATELLHGFLREKLSDIDERIAQLQALRAALASRMGLDCPMQADLKARAA